GTDGHGAILLRLAAGLQRPSHRACRAGSRPSPPGRGCPSQDGRRQPTVRPRTLRCEVLGATGLVSVTRGCDRDIGGGGSHSEDRACGNGVDNNVPLHTCSSSLPCTILRLLLSRGCAG